MMYSALMWHIRCYSTYNWDSSRTPLNSPRTADQLDTHKKKIDQKISHPSADLPSTGRQMSVATATMTHQSHGLIITHTHTAERGTARKQKDSYRALQLEFGEKRNLRKAEVVIVKKWKKWAKAKIQVCIHSIKFSICEKGREYIWL